MRKKENINVLILCPIDLVFNLFCSIPHYNIQKICLVLINNLQILLNFHCDLPIIDKGEYI